MARAPGAGGGALLFNGDRVLVLQGEESFGDKLPNSVNVLDTTTGLTVARTVNVTFCVFYHTFKKCD